MLAGCVVVVPRGTHHPTQRTKLSLVGTSFVTTANSVGVDGSQVGGLEEHKVYLKLVGLRARKPLSGVLLAPFDNQTGNSFSM